MYLASSHSAHLDLIFRYFYTIVLSEEVFHELEPYFSRKQQFFILTISTR